MPRLALLTTLASFSPCLACSQPSAEVSAPPSDASEPEAQPAPEAESEPEAQPDPSSASTADPEPEVQAAPEPEVQAAPEPEQPSMRASLDMKSIEVDGLTITDLQCEVEGGGGLLGSLALFATMAQHKTELDACAPGGAKPQIHWRFDAQGTEVVGVRGPSKKVEGCVAEVMKKVPPTMNAECRATVVIGT